MGLCSLGRNKRSCVPVQVQACHIHWRINIIIYPQHQTIIILYCTILQTEMRKKHDVVFWLFLRRGEMIITIYLYLNIPDLIVIQGHLFIILYSIYVPEHSNMFRSEYVCCVVCTGMSVCVFLHNESKRGKELSSDSPAHELVKTFRSFTRSVTFCISLGGRSISRDTGR